MFRVPLTSFTLDMELGVYSVMTAIQQTTVDCKYSQLGVEL